MHTKDFNRYSRNTKSGIISHNDIHLEAEADRLLTDAGAYELTSRSQADKDSYRQEKWPTVSLDDPSVASLVSYSNPFAGLENADSTAAVQMFGTLREQHIFRLDQTGCTRKEIASAVGCDLSTVARSLQRCQEHIQNWLRKCEGWRSVFLAECAGKPLPVDVLRDEQEISNAIHRLNDMDLDVTRVGDDEYQLTGYWVLRADQIITLADIGCVNTHKYGMVEL